MKTLGVTVIVLAFLVPSAMAETRVLNFVAFDEVSVSSGMRVVVRQGPTHRVEATGDSGDLDRLEVRQNGNRLEFRMQRRFLQRPGGRISLDITVPVLRGIGASGGSQAEVRMGNGSGSFSAALSGGSSLMAEVRAPALDVQASGGSQAQFLGQGDRIRVSGSGGSRMDLRDFAAGTLRASLSGGSRVTVTLDGEIDADMSGGSTVIYYGNARLGAINASGGSAVRKGF